MTASIFWFVVCFSLAWYGLGHDLSDDSPNDSSPSKEWY